MKSTSVRPIGPGAALLVLALAAPAAGQQLEFEGTVIHADANTVCFNEQVARRCGYDPSEVVANLVGPPPSFISESADDCDFEVELFDHGKGPEFSDDEGEVASVGERRRKRRNLVGFEDLSAESQICGTAGAEAALVRSGNTWNVYCGVSVAEQMNLSAPGNLPAEQIAICFTGGVCKASSEAALEAACAAFGTDLVQGVNLDSSGSLSTCACPEVDIAECAADDIECLYTDPENGERIKLDNQSAQFTAGGEGSRCSTLCQSTAGGSAKKKEIRKCIRACKAALD
jgi:hypothetical protein